MRTVLGPTRVRLSNAVLVSAAIALGLGLEVSGRSASVAPLQRPASSAQPAGSVQIDSDDIGGVVQSASGAEAGVWVIAETIELPTKFRKIVVTDERGRFLVPDLPQATYKLWVRGYGLIDSKPIDAVPGTLVNLTAVPAPTPRDAARVYPPNYWYSLLQVPPKSDFPGTGPSGNGISPALKTQEQWIDLVKQGCQLCHQMGSLGTRQLPPAYAQYDSSAAAWDRAVQSGQRGAQMSSAMNRFGRARGVAMFADWADRIAAGEVPPAPPRPAGVERNVVLTMWEWGQRANYVHDETSTDKRKPTVNANGPVYGVSITQDKLLIMDPVANTSTEVELPVLDPTTPTFFPQKVNAPSVWWGEELVYKGQANPHNPMIDDKGRVWLTHQIRPAAKNPAFCMEGSNHPSAKNFPSTGSSRQLSYYDPTTKKFTLIDTCYGTHHLQFAEDKDNTLWTSGGGDIVGWFKTKVFDETGDIGKAQGWCPTVLDYNGDGKIGPYTEPDETPDPAKDMRIRAGSYGIIPHPVDGSIWLAATGPFPGRLIRLELGRNPPATCKAEVFEAPVNTPGKQGYGPRGVDVDRNGLIWTGLSGSGQTASFDIRKCRVRNGPTATGQQCTDGWTVYAAPGPKLKGVTDPGSADYHYYSWVDQFNTLGLGDNIPITNGSGSDSLLALNPRNGSWIVLRIPYPQGFFSRGVDGRIDDPKAGWKGRGLWADFGTNTLWHGEGDKEAPSNIVHFQLRPDPLAR